MYKEGRTEMNVQWVVANTNSEDTQDVMHSPLIVSII